MKPRDTKNVQPRGARGVRTDMGLIREVSPARSWYVEIVAIWAALGALAYTGYMALA